MSSENKKSAEIKDERDYAIRKGKVLERFTQEFFTKHKNNDLYRSCYESLIRDVDPYEIIERLIEINADQYDNLMEVMPFVSPSYAIWKNNQEPK